MPVSFSSHHGHVSMNPKRGFISRRGVRIDNFAERLVKLRRLATYFACFSTAVALAVALIGCGAQPQPAKAVQPSAEAQASEARRQKQLQEQRRREQTIAALLAQAEQALARDKLTTPVHDNALDRYKAILLMSPDNPQAKAGVDQVAQRYCQLAYGSIQSGDLARARVFLQKAKSIAPNLVAVAPLQKQLAAASAKPNVAKPAEPVSLAAEEDVIALPAAQLKARSSELEAALKDLALQVKADDAYVLIVAGNDADGRWVYQTMKSALPGYRLRGNIERGSSPKIVLQAPL